MRGCFLYNLIWMNLGYSIIKNIAKSFNSLSYYHPLTQKTTFLILRESVDEFLKNHYIFSGKTSVNKDKNTHKKHICNQQEINLL